MKSLPLRLMALCAAWLAFCPPAASFCAETAGKAAALEVSGVSRPMYDAALSFAVPGSVFAIPVKAGQSVKEGDLLMNLDSRAEDSRLELLDSEINSTIKIRTLTTKIEQARLDMRRFADALDHKAATVMEYQHARLAHTLSALELEAEKFRVAQLRLNREELLAQRDRMYLYAPCNGYVEEVLVERGMAVDRNVPAIRLVAIDPILVELNLPVDKARQLKEGAPVEVLQPGDGQALPGVIAHVAKIAVLSNRTLKVRVHVPNPQGRPVGLMVTVRFPGVAAADAGSPLTENTQGEAE